MTNPLFHADELEAQRRAGGGPPGVGIYNFMPEQHRMFFERLRYLFLGTTDAAGWPLASLLWGDVSFTQSPDPVTLRINRLPEPADPISASIRSGKDIALLGIDLSTRRRNRANGQIRSADEHGFTMSVFRSFGNCPQYIQRRSVEMAESPDASRGDSNTPGATAEVLQTIDDDARSLIAQADTLFVASRSRPDVDSEAAGADISHRGGRPGFVRVMDDTLTIPDFRGNRYFNTLGNLLGDPRAGLLFIDFTRGDLLQLQGRVEIDWSAKASHLFEGAERLWRFQVTQAWRRRGTPLRASFMDFSPVTLRTGRWLDPVTATASPAA